MRVAMVAEPRDEHTAHVADLAAALTSLGHDVTVHGRRGEVALKQAWARARPDVVHTHSCATAAGALAAAARHDIPTVHSFHSFAQLAEVDHVLSTVSSRVTATCTAHVVALVAAGVPRPNISVVPDGVDVNVFTPEGPSAPTRTRHRLLALGDSALHAGFSTAIAALPALPDTELVILGAPTDDLLRYADRLQVADRVRFTRQIPHDHLPELLRSADIVVCTPWHEPCDGAVLNAMACGAPVVATTVGPLSDIVVDKVTGLLVPPRRPRALAEALHRLLAKQLLREQYGASGRDRAGARYAWRRIAVEITHVYERAGAPPAGIPAQAGARRSQPIGASQ